MENGESSSEAAARETLEEAGATVKAERLFAIVNLPHANQVFLLYLAALANSKYHAGAESSDVMLFSQDEIPWDELAFHTIRTCLLRYFGDMRNGEFRTHEIDF